MGQPGMPTAAGRKRLRERRRRSHPATPPQKGSAEAGSANLGREAAEGLLAAGKRFARCFKACRKNPSEKRVHALRIEARRLHSSLDLLEHTLPVEVLHKARRAARRKLNLLDELRDVQVQALALAHLSDEFTALQPAYKALCKRERKLAKRVRKRLKEAGVQKLLRRLDTIHAALNGARQANQERVAAFILRAIHDSFHEVVRRRRAIDPRFTDTIHCTRLAFKRLRYMLEALPSLRRYCGKRRLKQMQAYQTSMGKIQDMEVLLAELENFARTNTDCRQAIQPIMAELSRRHGLLISNYMDSADNLYTFWHSPRGTATPQST